MERDLSFLKLLSHSLEAVILSRVNGEESRLETLRFAQGDITGTFKDNL